MPGEHRPTARGALARSFEYKVITSPLGRITLLADKRALVGALCEADPVPRALGQADLNPAPENSILSSAESQLNRYFAGTLRAFRVPLAPIGTPFQLKVWAELSKIPYGRLVSYSELARRIRAPQATRAVATAVGANPIPVIIPCQRVVGIGGHLTGFASGIEIKRLLLELEGISIHPGSRPERDRVLPVPEMIQSTPVRK
jgi:methylated-DNA-[protein]-cysteine S-methyltransferase